MGKFQLKRLDKMEEIIVKWNGLINDEEGLAAQLKEIDKFAKEVNYGKNG